jgi:hypothetical protein
MIRHTAFASVIPLEVVQYVKDFFDGRPDLHVNRPNNPNVTKINNPWVHLGEVLEPVLSKYVRCVGGNGGNIYKHSNLYTTHVDSIEPVQMINLLLPIHVTTPAVTQNFVVFDQWVDNGFGQTWYGEGRDTGNSDFDINKKISLSPWQDDRVHDKTDLDMDPAFYDAYLEDPKHKISYFKGLTGTAYEFAPGNLLLFNSNNLHCTGKLTGPWKMGLHINFIGSLEELLV